MMIRALKLPRGLRILLQVTTGLIFIFMGLWKVGDNQYAISGRVGELFTFMESTGLWWDLVGWTQIVGGTLLITQRFATFAALLLFGVTLNIAAVNIALWPEFGTTMLLTAYAMVSLGLLLMHDLDRWQYIFWKSPPVLAELNTRGTLAHAQAQAQTQATRRERMRERQRTRTRQR
jgi:uncharacterized membrane protein YphA (DoxX/SURF4 family)